MRTAILLVLLAVAAGAVWWFSRPTPPPPAPITEVAPQRWRIGNATEALPALANPTANDTNATAPAEANATGDAADNATLADDPTVPRSVVRLVAQAVADRYQPGRTTRNLSGTGRLELRLQALGVRLAELPGIALDTKDPFQARRALMAYLLRPEVLERLERAYVPVFLEALDAALAGSTRIFLVDGAERAMPLAPEHRREAKALVAQSLRQVAAALASLAADQSHLPLVAAWQKQQQAVTAAQIEVWNVQARGDMNALAQATQKVDEALRQEAQVRRQLAANLKRLPLGEEDAVYLASWTARRAAHGLDVALLAPLAQRMEHAAAALEGTLTP